MPIKLKIVLVSKGIKQKDLAEQTGIKEDILSGIVTGRINPKPEEMKVIREAVKDRSRDLFKEV